MAKQPHSQNNHGFSFYNNDFCSSRLAELQQPQIPQYHEQQSQYQQQLPQNQQLWQGHVVPIIDPHVYDSNIFNFPTLVALFEKQWQETNQFINIQLYPSIGNNNKSDHAELHWPENEGGVRRRTKQGRHKQLNSHLPRRPTAAAACAVEIF
ncbi:RING-type E3 ubiquitin transferase [Trifolium repens]|nr:RING-type E3 ubiquitin transferase [Trifolium repens]